MNARRAPWWATVLLCTVPCLAEPPAPTLTLFFENDLFLGGDDNYTAGVGLSWVSGDAAAYGSKRFTPKVIRAFSFLPTLGDAYYRNFLSFTLGQEMYTPTDIESPVPPPDQQPYAGVLFFDTSLYGHGPRSMHGFTIRVGCVGPCSGAAEVQTQIHRWVRAPIPRGWDFQLDNELLLNVGYQAHRRVVRRTVAGRPHYDVAVQGGASLGNYYTGANAGVVARLGVRLPDNYSAASLRTGGASRFVGLAPPPGRGWRAYVFVGVQAYGIARFLPTDGNTSGNGPSVERDDLVGNLATGLVVGRGRFLFSWTRNSVAGFNELPDSRAQDFGTLTFSYYFARGRGEGPAD